MLEDAGFFSTNRYWEQEGGFDLLFLNQLVGDEYATCILPVNSMGGLTPTLTMMIQTILAARTTLMMLMYRKFSSNLNSIISHLCNSRDLIRWNPVITACKKNALLRSGKGLCDFEWLRTLEKFPTWLDRLQTSLSLKWTCPAYTLTF